MEDFPEKRFIPAKTRPYTICYRDLVLAVLVEIAVRQTALFQLLLSLYE